jgi:MEMO1 family protein
MTDHISSSTVRRPAVAGTFYPDDPVELRAALESFLASTAAPGRLPRAVIVPHAGYIYSGPTAGLAYASLGPEARRLRRILLLGPSHFVWFRGVAAPEAEEFATPLGGVRLDSAALAEVRQLPAVIASDEPHAREHSLEVQLPFLQRVAPNAKVVPLVAGDAAPGEVAAVIDALWDSEDTLIVVSSDLSHYHPYAVAQALDAKTAQDILDGHEDLKGEQACGCVVLNGLAHALRGRHLRAELIDLRNSGDTAGDRKRVVGYGAFGFYDA